MKLILVHYSILHPQPNHVPFIMWTLLLLTACTALANAATNTSSSTLADVCTTANIQAALSANNSYIPATIYNITLDPSSATANPVYNTSVSDEVFFPDATFDYCNVTFSYSHGGRGDKVNLMYWLPAPSDFRNRYLSTGGGGFAISSGTGSLPGGIIYGAVAGTTDGGFGGFQEQFDTTFLAQNGTINYQNLYMFGYEAIHELSVIGKQFTRNFYSMDSSTKLYAYYQACSEGGREGWSQIQRYGDELDGAVTGAPAFRFSFQQTNHLSSNVIEQTMGYYPSACEFERIVNATIEACDALDGKTDGVVARSDLCKLQFDMNSTVGLSYSCSSSSSSGGPGGNMPGKRGKMPGKRGKMSKRGKGKRQGPSGSAPSGMGSSSNSSSTSSSSSSSSTTINGTVTAQGAAVAAAIIAGLKDSEGRQIYFSYQPASAFGDAATTYNSTTGTSSLSVNSMGSEWVQRFINLLDTDTFADGEFSTVTADTLKNWMVAGWQRYQDTLETTWPDLTPFQSSGGKIIHIHGEADDSVPAASSVRYHDSVRSVMYPSLNFTAGNDALNEWYKLFIVPGAGHCQQSNSNGPWPQTTLDVLIDWVENGIEPVMLNATIVGGTNKGQEQDLCAWPLRPLWTGNGTVMNCEFDQTSVDSWLYDLDAIKMPVY